MCEPKEVIAHRHMIQAIGEALGGQEVAYICPPGSKAKLQVLMDQILGPVPWPDTLRIVETEEVDNELTTE